MKKLLVLVLFVVATLSQSLAQTGTQKRFIEDFTVHYRFDFNHLESYSYEVSIDGASVSQSLLTTHDSWPSVTIDKDAFTNVDPDHTVEYLKVSIQVFNNHMGSKVLIGSGTHIINDLYYLDYPEPSMIAIVEFRPANTPTSGLGGL